jgi:hypothetical protein
MNEQAFFCFLISPKKKKKKKKEKKLEINLEKLTWKKN